MKSPLLILGFLACFAQVWGEDITVSSQTFTGTQTVGTTTTGNIATQGTVTVASGANVTFVANNSITLKPGFTASGLFRAYIYIPPGPPTVAMTATATPNPVTGNTTTLSALGADNGGESALTYTWATTGTIPASVTFGANNGYNSAKSCLATFTKFGSYTFRVTIRDADGSSVTSDVGVGVNQTLTNIVVDPPSVSVGTGATKTFIATAKDQFGHNFVSQPEMTWTVSGGGTISQTGLFTAGATVGGPFTVTAANGSKNGKSSVSVIIIAAPTIASPAKATPSPVNGTTTVLSALGADNDGEPALTYTWATTGTPPASVEFGSNNGTNAAKTNTVKFTKAGTYGFRVTIKDAGNLTITSSVSVVVNPIFTKVTMSPTSASVALSGTQTFAAIAKDQFGTALVPQPLMTWTVSGGGTISTAGLFTAGPTAGGPFIVTATSGDKSDTGSVTVINATPTVANAAKATPNPVVGNTTTLSVLGADDGGESALIYTWANVGTLQTAVSFSANGTNAAKNVSATFSQTGTYILQATIRDAGNLTMISQVIVWVDRQETRAVATPTKVIGTTTTLSASGAKVNDASVIFTWQSVGYVPAPVNFSVNGNHAAHTTVVTFTKAGEYLFRVSDGSPVTSASTDGLNYVAVSVHQESNRIVVSPSSVTMVGTQNFTAAVTDQFSQPMTLNGQTFNWSASGGNSISSDGVFSGSVVGSSTVTCSTGALSGSANVTVLENATVMDNRKPTQVWIEKLADPFTEPASGTTANKAVFRLYVRNPPYSQSWTHPDGSIAGWYWWSKTHVVFSGTALQYSGNIYVGYDYSAYIYKEKVASAPYWPHFYSGVGPLPASGLWGSWVIDNGNNITLAYVDIFVSTSSGDIIGTEGSETIVATIQPLNPANAGYTEITPGGKSNTATAWIKEPGYTNTAPSITTAASATPNPAVSSDQSLGISALSQPITMSTALSVVASDNLGESKLTYVWEAIGTSPAPVTFSGTSGTNAHKNTTAQFSRAGDYTLRVTITDGEGLKVTSQVNVKVKPAATPILKITPEIIAVVPGQTYQFTAVPIDQFGHPIDKWLGQWKPTRWDVSGGGTIDQDGVFTAGSSVGGPFTITAYSQPYKNANLYAQPGAGWSSSGRALVTINPPPNLTIAITSPAANAVITSVPFNVTVSVVGDNVVDEVRLDGYLLGLKPTIPFTKSLLLSPPDGPFTITARAETIFGTLITTSRTVFIAARPLVIEILAPPDNKVFSQQMVFVTARRPMLTTTVTIQGRPATASGYEASAWVSLAPGNNIITAIGKDGTRTGQDSVPLIFTAPPGYNPNGDSDGDGVPNNIDLFPFDPTDSADRDNDGIGDNADKDPDDPNANNALIITKPTKSDTFRANYK